MIKSILMFFISGLFAAYGTKLANTDIRPHLQALYSNIKEFMNTDIKLWIILCSILSFIFLRILVIIFFKRIRKPEYTKLTYIKYNGVLWKWEWRLHFYNFKFIWDIYNITPYCSKHDIQLNSNNICPFCNAEYIIFPQYEENIRILIYKFIKDEYPSFRQ